MEWRNLTILHWRIGAGSDGATGSLPALPGVFLIGTCQRRIALTMNRDDAQRAEALVPADCAIERYTSREAYAFLLRFAAGLESKLAGETEIFGQLKEAWQQFSASEHTSDHTSDDLRASGDPLVRDLAPVMQKLCEDTRQIRAQHLSGLGSTSYGSLVRRLLAGSNGDARGGSDVAPGATLIVGAGQLAQSVAPWLLGSELWIWNRSAERASELAQRLVERNPECVVRVLESTPEAELQAWAQARDVVVCTPLDATRDDARVAARQSEECVAARQSAAQPGQVIHLGAQDIAGTPWAQLPGCTSLAAVFGMLQEHNDVRRRQIERARRACSEKALLRSLGGSVTQAHGWEDLLAFGSL